LRFSVLAAALLFSSLAHAFADASQFFPTANLPHAATLGASGEGLYFTGSPRFASRVCADCHIGGPNTVGLKLGVDDQSLFAGGYVPGKIYHLQVELTNESKGTQYGGATCTDPPGPMDTFTYQQCNFNGYGLEIDDATGPLAGPKVFCASPPAADGSCPMPTGIEESLVAPDGDAVFHNQPHSDDPNTPYVNLRNDPKIWDLWWTAPMAGTGPVTIYVAGVDGNGGGGTALEDQDPEGDDTVQATFFIQEAGAAIPTGANAGCATAAGDDGSHGLTLIFGLWLLVWSARKRRAS
jgi:hypothetical protein